MGRADVSTRMFGSTTDAEQRGRASRTNVCKDLADGGGQRQEGRTSDENCQEREGRVRAVTAPSDELSQGRSDEVALLTFSLTRRTRAGPQSGIWTAIAGR